MLNLSDIIFSWTAPHTYSVLGVWCKQATVIPPCKQAKLHPTLWTSENSQFHLESKSMSFITKHIGIHNESESLNLKPFCFEIIDTIQSEFSHWFSEFDMSLMKSVRVLPPASNCFLDKEELQPLYSSQFNYQKYQWRSSQCWNYYCEKHCLIKASWCVFKWKHQHEFGPVFEMVLEV